MLDFRQFTTIGKQSVLIVLFIGLLVIPVQAADTMNTTLASDIAAMLLSQDSTERAAGIKALSESGQGCMGCFLKITDNGTTEQRRGAVLALAYMPVPELATQGLLKALSDKDTTVRSLAAHALAKIGEPAATATARLLLHPNEHVRNGAALALNKMGKSAIPALTAMLKMDDPFAKAKAAWLLGQMGDDALSAAPALIHALKDDDMRVVHVISETLDLIGPSPALVYHELTLIGTSDSQSPVARIGAKAAPTLVRLLTRPGTPMGNIALYTLARMGTVAEPALRTTLATGTEGQKVAAALLLTGIDPELANTLPEELRRSMTGAMHTQ
ncbi:HEAT repeat domain-containing protein [uncultured Pseudodesulfovibrio sp.]|uniref:HEAT repeat domain-containing protein n=1 Tax=uncultured Pseudodesulfovibrio sp. TaxID=2035858 RepID=UPI0029C7800D|nr:HEAT repeat domain-containing protein [uncultured Pseudodesulfovibrio sp.]